MLYQRCKHGVVNDERIDYVLFLYHSMQVRRESELRYLETMLSISDLADKQKTMDKYRDKIFRIKDRSVDLLNRFEEMFKEL